MLRRSLLLVVLCAPLAACGSHPDERASDDPDIILVTVDTLRADRLGFMGYAPARTPYLDALAARGVTFTQAIAPVPRTTPALASLHTGLWPHHHGSREVAEPIVRGRRLAEFLAERGYWNVAVSANLSAGRGQGFDVGYAEFVGHEDLIERHDERLYRDLTDVPASAPGWAAVVSDEALRLVERAPVDQPMLLWTLYFDPHFLYRPPSPWQDGVEAADCWSLYAWGSEDLGRAGQIFNNVDGVASAALEHCSRLYDAEIAYADAQIGRLLESIAARRPGRGRVIVFTADHGENLGEAELFYEHGDNVHDAAIRVPLFFVAESGEEAAHSPPAAPQSPQQPLIRLMAAAGSVTAAPVSLIDVTPTLLNLVGIDPGIASDGRDLAAHWRSQSPERPGRLDAAVATETGGRITFAESAAPMYHEGDQHLETGSVWDRFCLNGPDFSLCQRFGDNSAAASLHERTTDPRLERNVAAQFPAAWQRLRGYRERWPLGSARILTARTATFKLIRRPVLDGGFRDTLIDLRVDRAETLDVSARHPDTVARLAAALDDWITGWTPPRPRPPDDARGRQLRALGYIQ